MAIVAARKPNRTAKELSLARSIDAERLSARPTGDREDPMASARARNPRDLRPAAADQRNRPRDKI
jgi:hypothetical protein